MAETPPTTPTYPTFVTAPGALGSEVYTPSLTPFSKVSDDLLNNAETRHRTDLVGLQWEQEGLIYVVNEHIDCKVLDYEYNKAGLRKPWIQQGALRVGRKIVSKATHQEMPFWVVDSFTPDGQHVGVTVHDKQSLAEQLDRNDKPEKRVRKFVWGSPNISTPSRPTERVELGLVNSNDPFYDIVKSHEEQNLATDLVGLSWTIRGSHFQISRHANPIKNQPGGRVQLANNWVVKTSGPDGKTILVKTYEDFELRNYLKSMASLYGLAAMDIHAMKSSDYIETPEEKAAKEISYAACEDLAKEQTAEATSIAPEDRQAAWLLSGTDSITARRGKPAEQLAEIAKSMEEVAGTDEGKRRINALNKVIDDIGLGRVVELGLEVQQNFLELVNKLRMPISAETARLELFVGMMADYSYFMNHSKEKEADKTYSRLDIKDPFSNLPEGKRGRNDIIDIYMGRIFYKSTIQSDTVVKPSKKINKDGQAMHELVNVYAQDLEPLGFIPPLYIVAAQQKAHDIFKHIRNEVPVLLKDEKDLGRQLARSAGR